MAGVRADRAGDWECLLGRGSVRVGVAIKAETASLKPRLDCASFSRKLNLPVAGVCCPARGGECSECCSAIGQPGRARRGTWLSLGPVD